MIAFRFVCITKVKNVFFQFFTVSKHDHSILTMNIEAMLFPRAVLSSGEGLMQNKFHDPHIRVL